MPRVLDLVAVTDDVLESIATLLEGAQEKQLSMSDIAHGMQEPVSHPILVDSIAGLAASDRLNVRKDGNRYYYSLPKRKAGRPRKNLSEVAATVPERRSQRVGSLNQALDELWRELAGHMMRAKHTIDKIEKQIPA